jgi:hypothetical protein
VTTEMQAEAISFTGAGIPPVPSLLLSGIEATTAGTSILVLVPPVVQP